MLSDRHAVRNLALALVHHPVYNKHREVVTTAVTNLDIHDIARAARTFGLARYYLVTPSADQQAMIRRIVGHWQDGWGASYNPDRREALSIIRVVASLEEARNDMQQGFSTPVVTVGTGARQRDTAIPFGALRERLQQPDAPHLLTLGTGWGLTDELVEQVNLTLEPIQGAESYNHLSVRSAAAIMLDRLLGAQTN
jgi:hypothetical protein